MTKGIIYYTDNRLGEPIFSVVQKHILNSGLAIVSVSLKPIDFGKNIVLKLTPGYLTMMKQIIRGLEESEADYVFFTEHDCLYPISHFNFTPKRDDIFYYNTYVWRWKYPDNLAISYDSIISLSSLCVNRKFALDHYNRRLKRIYYLGLDKEMSREPYWARKWGYEPGTKKTRRGGFSDDDYESWKSQYPIIDIRHGKTFSRSKVTLDSFIHPPENFRQTSLDKIQGWNFKGLL